MATQRCPKCGSHRIRQGYRPTPRLMKVLFRYHLLCDQCNWEFTGFAIPGTVNRKTKKKKPAEKVQIPQNEMADDLETASKILSNGKSLESNSELGNDESFPLKKNRVIRKVKVKLF